MRKSYQIRELAEQHGVKLTKRVWFDTRDEHGKRETRFLDVPRPADELHAELVAKGVLT